MEGGRAHLSLDCIDYIEPNICEHLVAARKHSVKEEIKRKLKMTSWLEHIKYQDNGAYFSKYPLFFCEFTFKKGTKHPLYQDDIERPLSDLAGITKFFFLQNQALKGQNFYNPGSFLSVSRPMPQAADETDQKRNSKNL